MRPRKRHTPTTPTTPAPSAPSSASAAASAPVVSATSKELTPSGVGGRHTRPSPATGVSARVTSRDGVLVLDWSQPLYEHVARNLVAAFVTTGEGLAAAGACVQEELGKPFERAFVYASLGRDHNAATTLDIHAVLPDDAATREQLRDQFATCLRDGFAFTTATATTAPLMDRILTAADWDTTMLYSGDVVRALLVFVGVLPEPIDVTARALPGAVPLVATRAKTLDDDAMWTPRDLRDPKVLSRLVAHLGDGHSQDAPDGAGTLPSPAVSG